MNYLKLLLICFTFFTCQSLAKITTFSSQPIDNKTTRLQLTINVPDQDYLYKDYLTFSVDNPAITLSEWKSNRPPVNIYDPTFKATKKIFNKPFKITLTAHQNDTISALPKSNLHVTYYLHSRKKIVEKVFPITIDSLTPKIITPATEELNQEISTDVTEIKKETVQQQPQPIKQTRTSFSIMFFLVKIIKIVWLQILLAFLLGLFSFCAPYLLRQKNTVIQEIRKFSGFFTVGIGLHLLNHMVPWYLVLILITLFTASTGIFYLYTSSSSTNRVRRFRNIVGILLIASSIVLLYQTTKAWYTREQVKKGSYNQKRE